jgi:hypothetical protein
MVLPDETVVLTSSIGGSSELVNLAGDEPIVCCLYLAGALVVSRPFFCIPAAMILDSILEIFRSCLTGR